MPRKKAVNIGLVQREDRSYRVPMFKFRVKDKKESQESVSYSHLDITGVAVHQPQVGDGSARMNIR